MKYYTEIKETLINNENYKKIKDYSKNKNDLNTYYEVGRLLVEAQGGEERAKYGNKLIKEYSVRLTKELEKSYSCSYLRKMRQFYIIFQKRSTLSSELSWSHYAEILSVENKEEINYYINITVNQNLSVRELRQRIKEKEYERLPYKEEIDYDEPKIESFIKDPILIPIKNKELNINENTLKELILENMDYFLKQLGVGYAYIGNEVKCKIGNAYHRIDILLFNYEFNSFVVVELKAKEFKAEYIGQTLKYMGYIDTHIKKIYHEKTIGIIICKENNNYVLKYIGINNILTTTYLLEEIK